MESTTVKIHKSYTIHPRHQQPCPVPCPGLYDQTLTSPAPLTPHSHTLSYHMFMPVCVWDMINMPSTPQSSCSSSHIHGKSQMIIMASCKFVQTYGRELGGDKVTGRGSEVQQGEERGQLNQHALLTKQEHLWRSY